MLGDFYPILDYSIKEESSLGFQFHREDINQGMVLLFRRQRSPLTSIKVIFRGINSDILYQLSFYDTDEKQSIKGERLLSGINITLPTPKSAMLITYCEE